MPKASPILANFNGGEISPLLTARVDLQQRAKSVAVMENMIAMVEGAATARPGFEFISRTVYNEARAWLVPFVFSKTEAYVLCFEPSIMRIYVNGGLLLNGIAPVVVFTPYAAEDLEPLSDGSCPLQFEQSGDILYIAHGNVRPHRVVRRSAIAWECDPIAFKGGPLRDENDDTSLTVYASAETGSNVTITANSQIFRESMIGGVMEIWEDDATHVPVWQANKSVAANALYKSGIHFYRSVASGTTGTEKPDHVTGTVADGIGGVEWTYQHSGFGRIRLNTFVSQTQMRGQVLERLPSGVIGSAKATVRWSLPAWDKFVGFPSSVTLWRERLWWGQGRWLYASQVSNYGAMSELVEGRRTADAAIRLQLAQRRIERISWLAGSEDALIIGTPGGEYLVREQSAQDGLAADNISARPFGTWGASGAQAIVIDDGVIYVQAAGREVLAIAYDLKADGLAIDNLSAFARHVCAVGIVQMAWQRQPWRVLWCVLSDGTMAGLTLDRRQSVVGWHRHRVGGVDARVHSLVTIPGAGGDEELWAVVSRQIANFGADASWSVERMASPIATDDPADARHLDGHLAYQGSPVTSVSGLRHMRGETARALVDGVPTGDLAVQLVGGTDGRVDLPFAGSKVVVGWPYTARLVTLPMEAGAADGTALAKTQRIHRATLRLYRTARGKAGGAGGPYDELRYREAGASGPLVPPLFTGDLRVSPWPDGYDRGARVEVTQADPLPLTLLAILPQVVTEDAG